MGNATLQGYDETYLVGGEHELHITQASDIMQDHTCESSGVRYIEAEISMDADIEDVDAVLHAVFEDQHKIHSQYDCTGRDFVWLLNIFRKEYKFDHLAQYIIAQRWTVDI